MLVSGNALAQEQVKVETVKLTDTLYMLIGQGGNIGVSAGPDGVYLIDDQFAPMTPAILDAVRAISSGPIRLVVNTHWHGDHTGGNENLGKEGALIFAHENVRSRMEKGQEITAFERPAPPAPKAALPHLTYNDRSAIHLNGEEAQLIHVHGAHTDGDTLVYWPRSNEGQEITAFERPAPPAPKAALPHLTYNDRSAIHLNGEEAQLIHVHGAHTDGDTLVYWPRSNVVHTGDLFFNGFYPVIDAWSGGGIDGVIAALGKVLDKTDAETRFMPGHGPLATRADLIAFREMLKTASASAHGARDKGLSYAAGWALSPSPRSMRNGAMGF